MQKEEKGINMQYLRGTQNGGACCTFLLGGKALFLFPMGCTFLNKYGSWTHVPIPTGSMSTIPLKLSVFLKLDFR